MLSDKKGSVTILTIYICTIVLMLSLVTKSIFMENYYYYKQIKRGYNLYLIENAIIKNIYQNYKQVIYHSKTVSYEGKMIKNNNNRDLRYQIKLSVFKDIYEYEVKYDRDCYQILEFNNVSVSLNN